MLNVGFMRTSALKINGPYFEKLLYFHKPLVATTYIFSILDYCEVKSENVASSIVPDAKCYDSAIKI